MAAHVLNLQLELLLSALHGSLECHVLKEVSGSVVSGILISATSVNPDANSSGVTMSSL